MRALRIAFLLAAAFAAPAALRAQTADRVCYLDDAGRPQVAEGVVSDMTCEFVTILVREQGIPTQVNADRVQAIEFRRGPLARVQALLGQGNYDEAERALQAARNMPRAPAWMPAAVLWYTAQIQAGRGEWDRRAETLSGLLPGAEASFYALMAADLLADYHLARGDAAAAERVVSALEAHARSHRVHRWSGQIGLLRARTAQVRQDWSSALREYRGLLSDADPMVRTKAARMEIRTLLDSGDVSGAAERGRSVVSSPDARDTVLRTAAHNAIGAEHLRAGRAKEALLSFLHGVLEYGDSAPNTEHEYALAYAAVAAARTALASSGELQAEYVGHARTLAADLNRRYPSSRYAAEVQQALRNLPSPPQRGR